MNNYRNYGNRRVSGETADCGCNGNNGNNYGRAMRDRNYRRADGRQGMDCGCDKKEIKNETDCGCGKRETRNEGDCGCGRNDVRSETDCGCSTESMYREMRRDGACCEEDMPGKALAMAYVPWQTWRKLYEICEGFSAGTIFKELDLEFSGRRCN